MKRGAKLAIIIAGLLLAALIAAIIIVNVGEGNPPKGPDMKNSITYYLQSESSSTVFSVNDKLVTGQIGGVIDSYLTVDGSVAIVRAGTGLYRVDEEGILLIYPAGVERAALSLDSNYILFCTTTKAFVYDHGTGELIEFADMNAENVLNLAISPSGETFGVTVVDENDVAKTYLYHHGETTLRSSDSCIIAVSDDGKFAYYMEAIGRELTGKLYCLKNGDEHLIAEGVSPYFEINNDLSEITFDINNKTYYSVNGGKAKQLVDASILMVPKGCCSSMGGKGCVVLLRNLDTIFNCVYYTTYKAEDKNSQTMDAYDLYYVNGSHKPILLAKGASQYSANADGDSILCVVDGSLYKVSAYSPDNPTLIADMVYSYSATRDFNDIYVLDQYACLNYIDGARSTTLMSNVSYSVVTKDGICLFISDYDDGAGTLQWANKAETGTISEKVYSVEAFAGGTTYYANPGEEDGVFDVYMSADSKQFELLVEQVQLIKAN